MFWKASRQLLGHIRRLGSAVQTGGCYGKVRRGVPLFLRLCRQLLRAAFLFWQRSAGVPLQQQWVQGPFKGCRERHGMLINR